MASTSSGIEPGRRVKVKHGKSSSRVVRGAPITLALYVTFSCMGFGTGWSGVDSIFQQVNKYITTYDDLSFASDLVYVTSAAAAAVLVATFLGLYCAPVGVDFRTVGFFESTISFVLVTSCSIMLSLALFWDKHESVVMCCAFCAAVMGNLQAFVIYPFFNAFYRPKLIASLNFGETATSLVCGSLALLQSPGPGIENFTSTHFFLMVFICSLAASLAWTSLKFQTGYRKEDEDLEWELGDNEPIPEGSVLLDANGAPVVFSDTMYSDTLFSDHEPNDGGPASTSYGALDGTLGGDEKSTKRNAPERPKTPFKNTSTPGEFVPTLKKVLASGGAVSRGAHGITLPDDQPSPDGRKKRRPSYFDLRKAADDDEENSAPFLENPKVSDHCRVSGPEERIENLWKNLNMVLNKPKSEVVWLLPLATANTLMTWSVISSFIPFSAAAATGTCDTQDVESIMFIRLCTSFLSICRVLGPLCVRTDGRAWGDKVFIRWCGVIGVAINAVFCVPALCGWSAGDPLNKFNSEIGKTVLLLAYVASTPFEPFMQLHLLVATQREHKGSSTRIIDAGFSFAAITVAASFGVACATARYASTGTAVCG